MSCLRPATSPSVAITSDVVSAETVAADPSAGLANDAVQSSERDDCQAAAPSTVDVDVNPSLSASFHDLLGFTSDIYSIIQSS